MVEKLIQSGTIGSTSNTGAGLRSSVDGESVWNVSVYCDNSKDWYVVASVHQAQGKKNRYFRVGCYAAEQIAIMRAREVNPEKLSKSKKVGTIDLYRNRTWRARIKYVKENLHIGYFVKKKDAHLAMLKLMNDTEYLSSRCADLNRKREMNRQRLKRRRLNSGEEFDEKFATGKKRWTDDDVALLTRLRDASTPWSSVARQLGRTIEACKSRIWRQLRDISESEAALKKNGFAYGSCLPWISSSKELRNVSPISTEHLRDDTPVVKLEDVEWPEPRPYRRIKLEKEESGRLAKPTAASKPFYRQPYQ